MKYSRKGIFPLAENRKLSILVNGPSLSKSIEDNKEELCKGDVLCVNLMMNTDYFFELKPRYYVYVDSMLWEPQKVNDYVPSIQTIENNNLVARSIEKFIESVSWTLYFFIPMEAKKNKVLMEKLKTNSNIKLVFLNTSRYFGFDSLRNFFWKKNFCAPIFCNVIVVAVVLVKNYV